MINSAGFDSPYYYWNFVTCIDNLATYSKTLNSIPTSVDVFKAVAWWYDRRHDDGLAIDNIDLTLRDLGTGKPLLGSWSLYDNKEMLYYEGIGGKSVALEIHGTDVTTDGEGCGTNSMKVFFTFYYEDTARDDANGPAWDAAKCVGVEPGA